MIARPKLIGCICIAAALLAAAPAMAQFGSIFSDSPPRPPADVPSAPRGYDRQAPYYAPPPPPPPSQQPYYPSQSYPAQNYPRQAPQQRPYDESQAPRPPADIRSDLPPEQPLPAPMNLPPASRPGGGTIQSQDLAPPPGTEPSSAAPPPGQPQPQPGAPQPGIARTPPGAPPPAAAVAPPSDEIVVEPPPQRIANPTAVFSGLDKITGRIISFDIALNETVQFGALQVTPRVCYSRPPTETPNTDAFVEVDEVTLQGEIKRIFTGWMFAASPGLHAVEHPIYDVWLTDCKGGRNPAVAEVPDDAAPVVRPPASRPPAPQRRAPVQQPRAQQAPGTLPALR